jgi:Domain of unknown function (DUF6504)
MRKLQQPGEQIPVTWDRLLRRPCAFVWRRHRYRVERVVQRWVVETGWWDEQIAVSRHYWRVRAGGRLFDLSFDHREKVWRMERCLN